MAVKIKTGKVYHGKGSQEPEVERTEESPIHDSIERHPAYGQIGASRIQGNIVLYGSDFVHHGYVVVRVRKSKLGRGLMNDHAYDDGELIEVALSEAQWAHFVSTLNSGMGTQCTIQHIGGEEMPKIPRPKDRHRQFSNEVIDRMQDFRNDLVKMRREIEALPIGKAKKKELLHNLRVQLDNLAPNLEYMGQQFTEHMERTTEAAKIEVGAYIQSAVQRAGLKALRGEMPISLPKEDKEES